MAEVEHDSSHADKVRALKCDEDQGVFKAKLRQVARAPKPEKELPRE